MTDLPPGWTWATLEDLLAVEERPITDGPFGSKLATRHYTDSGARVIRLQNIGDGVFRDGKAFISEEYFQELRDHEVRAGDLLLASLGEELPRVCIAPDLGNAIVKADCIRARIHPELDTRWVLYALMAPATRAWATSRIKGVGRPRLGLGGIRQIPVPVPPPAEQRRIVAALEDHLSNLNAGRSRIDANAKRLTAWRSSLIRAAVSGDLLPRSTPWEEVTIGDLARVGTGCTPSRSNPAYYEGGTIPWVTSSLLNEPYVERVEQYVTPQALAEARLRVWPEGTLLLAMYGEGRTRGRCSELRIPATINQACAAIAFPSESESRRPWVKLVLEAMYERNRKLASGGVQPNLNLRLVRSMRIPLPPLGDQDAILAEVDRQLGRANMLMSALRKSQARAKNLQRALLEEAFAGRLVAQDPADEPASVLLERIRSERAARGPVRRGRRSKGQVVGQEAML